MLNFLHTILIGVATLFIGVTNLVSPNITPTPTLAPVPTPTPIQMITAKGSYTEQGYKINLTLAMPKAGGKVTGVVDGDCTGRLSGEYSGSYNDNPGYFNAKGEGECGFLFLKIQGTIESHGTIYLSKKSGTLDYTGEAQGYKKSGTIDLILN